MRRIIKAILFSVIVAALVSLYVVLKRRLFQGDVRLAEIGLMFACTMVAFWLLVGKEWVQAKNTKRARELDDLATINDDLVKMVQANDEFSFRQRSVVSAHAALHYRWVIQHFVEQGWRWQTA